MDWLAEIFGEGLAQVIVWGVGLLLLLILLLIVIRLFRAAIPGTFIAGGSRKHRLAVIDAAAVDSTRRLVLVRRDNTEHLLLIGGSNDLVVEAGIGVVAPSLADMAETGDEQAQASPADETLGEGGENARRISAIAAAVRRPEPAPPPAPAPAPQVAAAEVRPVVEPPAPQPPRVQPSRPAPAEPARYVPPSSGPAATIGAAAVTARPQPEPGFAPQQPAMAPAPPPFAPQQPSVEAPGESMDQALLRDLEETLAAVKRPQPPAAPEPAPEPARIEPVLDDPAVETSLEDEMSKLLADLSRDNDGKAG
ncbi:MAG: flagellar biosynthetic protein FliO [Notoacmeibacter sp.]|nr:flagellar biosynthetic protein FliO [Notoacmeibacter sp.]